MKRDRTKPPTLEEVTSVIAQALHDLMACAFRDGSRAERERIAAMLATEAATHRECEAQVRPKSEWLASAHRWQAESFERIAADLRKDGE